MFKMETSIREAAEFHGLKKSMLHKRLQKIQRPALDIDLPPCTGSSKYSSRHVFSSEEETMLANYLIKCSKMNYGLSYKQVRDFAYSYAVKLERHFPKSWEEHCTAGVDWMKGFMKRHPQLSLRKPENTSLARNVNFKKHNVQTFYDNFEKVMEKHKIPTDRIINVDESGITTVLPSPKVVAPTGAKQVGQCVSAERGELVTFCAIVTASGNTIPPAYVYPRVNFKEHFIVGAPLGSVGFASRSGWMTREVFVDVIKHIQKHTCADKDNPVLILFDNHESHVSLETILFCRENGMILLTFPPHTSHRLQPLDVALFAPFKNHCKFAFNKWISEHPGKSISIYDIAGLTATAYNEAFCRKNIVAGFLKTGIVPFNPSVFTDDDFLGSLPTDHPMEAVPDTDSNKSTSEEKSEESNEVENICDPSCSTSNRENEGDDQSFIVSKHRSKEVLSPEQVRPFPKSEARKNSGKGRKKGKSCILTETPEKNRVELEVQERKEKLEKKPEASRPKPKRKLSIMCEKKTEEKKLKINNLKLYQEVSDSDSCSFSDLCEEEGLSPLELESESETENEGELVKLDGSNVNVNDFVLVKLASKKTVKYFVAQIGEKFAHTEFNVNFLKKKDGLYKFVMPDVPDTSATDISDIIKLPQPNIVRGTVRAFSVFSFRFNFTDYKMG